MYPHLGGFESTQIFGSGRDVLGTTRHIDFWHQDLTRLFDAGIGALRYSIPWHRIETEPGTFDWSWIDGPMEYMLKLGLEPIVDPLHHTSFPAWLVDGFLNPRFPALYERFVDQFSTRYPWVRRFTVFNEPLPTTLFCSLTGMWYPHRHSERDFVSMTVQVARSISAITRLLKQKNANNEIVYVDTAEHHRALDKKSVNWVNHANSRRFLVLDLILGRINSQHSLYRYLRMHGAMEHDLRWFLDHPASIDILGLDYYIHSEMEWFWCRDKARPDIHALNRHPRGFADIAQDYMDLYPMPAMLTETNIRGTIHERITWLKFMEEQCEDLLLSGCDLRGFCWYPSIDSTDWSNACTRCTEVVDPQGIWTLDADRTIRHDSELAQIYGQLARGEITSKNIPAYSFGEELRHRLAAYSHLMNRPADTAARLAS